MKKTFLNLLVLFTISMFALSSCIIEPDEEVTPADNGCGGKGTLSVTNKSLHTVQKIRIDGTNFGTIDPDETKKISLAAGRYELQIIGVSGGSGCNSAFVNIAECQTVGRSCSY